MSVNLLRQVPGLATLPEEELAHLATSARIVAGPEGALLFREGGADDRLCVLAEGQVEIVKALGEPDERRLAVCAPGALLGEMSLFSQDGAHTASVRALTPTRVLELSRAEFDALVQREPSLAYALVQQLSRRLDEGEHVAMRDLRDKNRRLAEALHELETAQAQLIEAERLERELEIARDIQESMLPQELPDAPGYDLGAMMVPARLVGGDFFDVMRLGGDRLALAVGDVCGKGAPAALFMAQCFSLLRAEAGRNASPADTLRAINRHLLAVNRSAMYVTLLYAVLDVGEGRLRYARAGHPPMLLMSEQSPQSGLTMHPECPFKPSAPSEGRPQAVTLLPTQRGQMLGLFEEPWLDEGAVALTPGDLVLLYSDGLTEAFDAAGAEFSLEQIGGVLTSHPEASAQALCAALWQAVQQRGAAGGVLDDFTVLAIKRVCA